MDLLSTRDLADAIGASESSLRRWTNAGVIRTTRTPGGHRRIPRTEAIRFVRETSAAIVRPELLGLPGLNADDKLHDDTRPLEDRFLDALLTDDSAAARSLLLQRFLAGSGVAELCDGPMRHALHAVGELWRHDTVRGIMAEHRATDIVMQIVSQLRQLLPTHDATAPAAVGGAPEGDGYAVPSMMAAATLAEAGYRDVNLGPASPLNVLAAASERYSARMVWLSISNAPRREKLEKELFELAEMLARTKTPLFIGGRATVQLTLPKLPGVRFVSSMTDLAQMARELIRPKAKKSQAARGKR